MTTIFLLLLALLNYFWLDADPEVSARLYCDQHCFKIGSEVVESIWDAALSICPDLDDLADQAGLPKTYRRRRHAKAGCLWHPLSVWHGLCRANMQRGLINADEIFKEHQRRTGTSHSAWADCKFLIANIGVIDFNSRVWSRWFRSQNGQENKYTPTKTKKKDLLPRQTWISIHAATIVGSDRNVCDMTEPPQCINGGPDDIFTACRVPGDVVAAYRLYYIAKTNTISGGMRYFYTSPPTWLGPNVKTKRATKKITKLDTEGFIVIKFP